MVARSFFPWLAPRLLPLLLAVLVAPLLSGQLVISEFRVRGPNGANDEFIEIHNNSTSAHTVTAASGTGYGVAASDGTTRCTIPNGTVIPGHGHYLCVNSVGYSLAAYPAGNGTTATGDATYTTDIPDNAGIALFNNNTGGASYSLANRLDAVGSTSEANAVYREGAGLPTLVAFPIDYAWVRDACGKAGGITTSGACPNGGFIVDTDDNAADFYFVDTNGTNAGGGQRLGAPGPENLSSPVFSDASFAQQPLDPCAGALSSPNFGRDLTSDPANNSVFGTIDLRRTYTNNTGVNVTRLRFRIIDLTTFPAPIGFADLRARTSTSGLVTVDRAPCGAGTSNVTVEGTTLEQPPSQPNGGGFNSTLSVNTVTLATPLAPGASLDVRFLFGVQQTGTFRLGVIAEALPEGGTGGVAGGFFEIEGCTDGDCADPTVVSSTRADPDPTAPGSVDFTVTFSEAVTGVDVSDFTLTTTGTLAGSAITSVSGGPTVYTVTINTGTGDGTVRLDVVDDDSIQDAGANPLGGAGAGNGNFTTGEAYTVAVPPTVVSISRADPNPTSAASVDFTVIFSEPVTGVDATDFALATVGVTGAAITGVAGAGTTWTVTVSTGTGAGTIGLNVVDDDTIVDGAGNPLGGPGAGNGNFTGTELYTVIAQGVSDIPALDARALAMLAVLLAAVAMLVMRRA